MTALAECMRRGGGSAPQPSSTYCGVHVFQLIGNGDLHGKESVDLCGARLLATHTDSDWERLSHTQVGKDPMAGTLYYGRDNKLKQKPSWTAAPPRFFVNARP